MERMNPEIIAILSREFLGNTVWKYAIASAVFFVLWIAFKLFKIIIITRLRSLSERTKTDLDNTAIDAVDAIGWPFYASLSAVIAVQGLSLPNFMPRFLWYILVITGAYYASKFTNKFIDYFAVKLPNGKVADKSAISLMKNTLKLTVSALLLMLVLQNLGYEISALVTGLGISGIAVAFALQNILSDIFASFSIYFDKPFKTGDFIVVGNDMGVVKKIGVKSTRIRALQGHEIVISNKELTESRVHNYKKMERRRVVFSIGVEYGTLVTKLKKIPKMIKDSIEAQEGVTFDRAHFKEFGDFALLFEVVYYVESGNFNKYRDIQQEINLSIAKKFKKAKISMAFPSTTVYLKK